MKIADGSAAGLPMKDKHSGKEAAVDAAVFQAR
jgi:hypothetical protein